MKKILFFATTIMAFLASCDNNGHPTLFKVETGTAVDITAESAVLHGVVNIDISQYDDIEFGMMVAETEREINAHEGDMYQAKVLIGKDFKLPLSGLTPRTKYYYSAWVFLNNTQYEFGRIKDFVTLYKGFSVSDSKKVTFSKGNLQYHPANNKWRFAASQLDYIGKSNSNCYSTYNGWLDLFGWSTNSNNFGVSVSIEDVDYLGSFIDWGTNKIGNDAPNTWRTLTKEEWGHLFAIRPNASSLKGVAQVNGVNGLILLPDDWICPAGITFKSGFNPFYGKEDIKEDYGQHQTFTIDQWSKLETAGAVFMPAAGFRDGSNVGGVQNYGYYWSATEDDSNHAITLYFPSTISIMYNTKRRDGLSVRLVKDVVTE